jgi:DNA-binding NtrC family response regulator
MEGIMERAGHDIVGVRNSDAGIRVLLRGGVDLVLCDMHLLGANALELVDQMRAEKIDVPVVVLSAQPSIEQAITSIKAGAIDYLTKPVQPIQLDVAIAQALELTRLRRESGGLRRVSDRVPSQPLMIGEGPAHRSLLDAIAVAAPTSSTVLIEGESGTGKELVARSLHLESKRSSGPFISVNCAALPEHLVESIMFGHEKGAFTGAMKRSAGAFERADRGTLLLDEVSEMRLDLQAKLLRALQEQEFERVGGTSPIQVDVRVIATTNRELYHSVEKGLFRADLFYRLNVVPIKLAPLRDRKEDIPTMAQHFADQITRRLDRTPVELSQDLIETLIKHTWPGNVRELSHTVERALILSNGGTIESKHLCLDMATPSARLSAGFREGTGPSDPEGDGTDDMGEAVVVLDDLSISSAEEVLIQAALVRTDGNRTQAAKLLGIGVRTLRNKLNGEGKTFLTRPIKLR